MREIVMDTETTGIDPHHPEGRHRIVEIGCVELINHLPTGNVYHQYINPERSMPREAFEVHGLGDEFLREKPLFAEVADAFVDFIGDAKLVIHNASFDIGFLNAEFEWMSRPSIPMTRAVDTLAMARRKFPGAQANLDALCKRFNVDRSARVKHGALLDSELLAEVYLELLGGRQRGLSLDVKSDQGSDLSTHEKSVWRPGARPKPLPQLLTEEERAAHTAFVDEIGEGAIWRR